MFIYCVLLIVILKGSSCCYRFNRCGNCRFMSFKNFLSVIEIGKRFEIEIYVWFFIIFLFIGSSLLWVRFLVRKWINKDV